MPVVEERAVVLKRKKVTGGVRVRTVVRHEDEVIDEPYSAEEVEVERVALDPKVVDGPVPVRQEGDTTIITLHEEEVVVVRRLKVVGEVRLTKRRSTRHARKRVALRREEAVVERVDAAGDEDDAD